MSERYKWDVCFESAGGDVCRGQKELHFLFVDLERGLYEEVRRGREVC